MDDEREYLGLLVSRLEAELAELSISATERAQLLAGCSELRTQNPQRSVGESFKAYEAVCAAKGAARARVAQFADTYASMEDFWREAEAQEQGRGLGTYWDTYENGARRALEHVAAAAFGAEGSLLVNSGMSALDVALGGSGLGPGDRLLVHEHAYFETVDYLSRVAARRGVQAISADLTDARETARRLAEHEPRAVLLETAVNCPPCDVPRSEPLLDGEHLLIVDNSLLSHGVPWFELVPPERLVVFESGIKYLTRGCGMGVVYAQRARLETLREYARATGQLLQEKAFAFVQRGELDSAARRVGIHGRNALHFVEQIDRSAWASVWCATISCADRTDALAQAVSLSGPGSVVYVSLDSPDERTVERRHREIATAWCAQAQTEGIGLRIRAGFGWSHSSVRAYESSKLNQAYAPVYLRISLGLESTEEVAVLAGLLNELAAE